MSQVERPDTRRLWDANAPAWVELSRAGFDVYRDLVNTPAFFAILPDVDGLVGLDLGCGEGHNTRLLASAGAELVALDISEPFLAAAASEPRSGIRYVRADGAVLPFADASFDFVTGFMSLMDVADPETTLVAVTRVLRPGGFVQFSVVHPVTGTPVRRWVENDAGEREALAIGDYFYEGPFSEEWIFSAAPEELRRRHRPFTITYARRTFSGWIHAVLDAGLLIEAVDEPHADVKTADEHPEVADTRIAPYFLVLRARKPKP
jgi:SAM-dependent methyltransferase